MDQVISQLKRHNELRAKHHAPPLVLSDWLCKRAQQWAGNLSSSGQFQHSDCELNGKSLGQNIFMTSGELGDGQASQEWYNQIKDYDYENGEDSWQKCGHFTQLVWKGSKEVGFGISNGYVVANYYPAGNMMGDFSKNVAMP